MVSPVWKSSGLPGDGIVAGSELRDELIRRLVYAESKQLDFPPRRNPILPV